MKSFSMYVHTAI